jgi:hypothetical protein
MHYLSSEKAIWATRPEDQTHFPFPFLQPSLEVSNEFIRDVSDLIVLRALEGCKNMQDGFLIPVRHHIKVNKPAYLGWIRFQIGDHIRNHSFGS